MQGTTDLCDACGAPAQYVEDIKGPHRDDLCDACARNRGAEFNGEAYAALKMFGFAISLMRGVYIHDAQIREGFEGCMTAPHSEGSYSFGGDQALGSDYPRDRPWMRTCRVIDNGEVQS